MYNWLYHTNMSIKFLINRIKIDGFRALRRGPENGPKFWSQILVRKIFPPTATEKKIDTNGDHQGS